MDSAFGKLHKVLNLEKEQGCQDRAVIGGLSKFLSVWRSSRNKRSSRRQTRP